MDIGLPLPGRPPTEGVRRWPTRWTASWTSRPPSPSSSCRWSRPAPPSFWAP